MAGRLSPVCRDISETAAGREPGLGRLFLSAAVGAWIQPLLFGNGTQLRVYPKESNVLSLALLLPSKDESVCLASGGIQADDRMTLTNSSGPTVVQTSGGAMYSLGNTNFFAAFGTDIEECEIKDKKESKPENSEAVTEPQNPDSTTMPCIEDKGDGNSTAHTNDGPKVRFRVLTVNSIRVLLAKAVAFDILVTVKAMIF